MSDPSVPAQERVDTAKLRKQFEGSGSFGAPIFALCDAYDQLRSEANGPPPERTQLREAAKLADALRAENERLQGVIARMDKEVEANIDIAVNAQAENAELLALLREIREDYLPTTAHLLFERIDAVLSRSQ